MHTKHGVLSQGMFTWIWSDGERKELSHHQEEIPFSVADFTLSQLCQVAEDNKLTHLWVMPNSLDRAPDAAFFAEATEEWDLKPTWEYRQAPVNIEIENHLRSVYGWRIGGGQGINIIFIGPWAKWNWLRWEKLKPIDLLSIVADLEQKLGVPVGGSPANVGVKFLRANHSKHSEWFAPPAIDLAELPFREAARDILWTRIPEEEELNRQFLVKIDKNSAYARACQEFRFGVGVPVHVDDVPSGVSDWPGIYKITVLVEPINELFPPPVWFTEPYQWVATPILKFLEDIGARVMIHEGWQFPESHYIFKQWAEALWSMRKQYAEKSLLRDAFKQIITETIGLTASGMFDEGNFKFRPDWYCQIVAGNRAIMLRNMARFVEILGYPLICHIDSLVYAVNAPLQQIMPDNRDSLGGYKHEWSLEMTDEIREILTSTGGSTRKLQMLNKIARAEHANT